MNLDVYRQSEIQDPDTGAIVKEWNYYKTLACHAKGIISNTATTGSGNRQTFSNRYIDDQIVQIRTSEKLTAREKVTNIRDSENNVIWEEINYPNDSPTVFEVVGLLVVGLLVVLLVVVVVELLEQAITNKEKTRIGKYFNFILYF
jgi:hypothetical protein